MKKEEVESKLVLGQTFPVTIRSLGINGEGVGYFKRQVVFIQGALPGEEIVAEVTAINRGFAEATIKTIRKASPHRVEAPCPVYEQCGGCQLQHLSYTEQLNQKRDMVMQALERFSGLLPSKITLHDTIGMENPWNYRNKSQQQLGKQDDKIIAGLYSLNTQDLVDISGCLVQHDAVNKVTKTVTEILQRLNLSIYNSEKQSGNIRTVVVRVGVVTGEVQLVLVTSREVLPKQEAFVREVQKHLPEVKSIMQNINNQRTSIIFGDETKLLGGEEVIEEMLGDLSFELSARAFFQLNPAQTVKLYDEVKKAAQLTGEENVVDAYCGVGTIGLWLAKDAKEVRGMDVVESAIYDARENADRNELRNTIYQVGKAEEMMPKWAKEGFMPDVVVMDPPRTGCDPELIKTLLDIKPKRIVYVSCNPSTLAKNISQLGEKFRLAYVQPLDMFPQTSHVECVALLERKY